MVAAQKQAQQGKTTTAANKWSKHDFCKNTIHDKEISLSEKENSKKINNNNNEDDKEDSKNENEEENEAEEQEDPEIIEKLTNVVTKLEPLLTCSLTMLLPHSFQVLWKLR